MSEPMVTEICDTCRFWWWNLDYTRSDLQNRQQYSSGCCHRHAPIGDLKWPITNRYHYCGEFEMDQRLRLT
jgi:hypothetical protein